ncbi:MAG: GGDEF domain-containing phosphodiesterase [Butyrivibrio sp.]|nr:GGDEF domain-containing phosphodiesterase [Butyrivibrio sp.]
MNVEEYTYQELKHMLDYMKRMYDTVRLVDPVECRELTVDTTGSVHYGAECFSAWSAASRCANCTSYRACMSCQRQTKEESFEGNHFLVQSIPIKLILPERSNFSCVLELINVDISDKSREKAAAVNTAQHLTSDGRQISQGMSENEYIITHDLLTRLYNLDGLCREIRRVLVDEPEVDRLVITGDVRHFRIINERYGREKGNEVLLAIAETMQKCFGEDAILGRTEADHFVMCVPEDEFDEGVLMNAMKQIGELVDTENYHLYFHLGVYRVEDPDLPVSVMIDRADMALRTLHDRPENILTYYTNKLLKENEYAREFLKDFDKTIEKGLFQIHLQPVYTADEKPVACEALSRLLKEDGTIVASEKYIHILENNEYIARLDHRNWDLVIKQLKEWQGTKMEKLFISVNVSPKDFFYMNAVKSLKSLLHTYRIDSSKLIIEISEDDLMNDTERHFAIIDEFREAGFLVAIDNFGIGNVSLNMLKDVHADYVKFDKKFVAESDENSRCALILEYSMKLAKELGFKTVAEGVETKEQFDRLKALGCDFFQGYYFSRPMPIKDFEELLL